MELLLCVKLADLDTKKKSKCAKSANFFLGHPGMCIREREREKKIYCTYKCKYCYSNWVRV